MSEPAEYVRLTFRPAGSSRRRSFWAARTKNPGAFEGRNPDGSTKGTAKVSIHHLIIVAMKGRPIPSNVRIEEAHDCLRYAELVVGTREDCEKCQECLAG